MSLDRILSFQRALENISRNRRKYLTTALCAGLAGCGGGGEADSVEPQAATRTDRVSALATTWTTVAYEGQTFTVPASTSVRFGAGSSWVYLTLSGSVVCSNTTFGDPAYGTPKTCQTGTTTPAPSPAPAPAPTPAPAPAPSSWTTVAYEGQTFTVPASTSVRFGTGSSWAYLTLSGSVVCSNVTFGDPAYGVSKVCQTGGAAATPPPPAPAPSPAPAPAPAPSTWTTVAYEGQTFTLSQSTSVRFGAGTSWVYRTMSGSVVCSTATFGDPAYGVGKTCQTGGTTPTTTTQATLGWNASTSPTVVSYRLYYGTASRSYGNSLSVGNNTSYSFTGQLTAGTRYYFAVTAVDAQGNESTYSNEANKLIN